jgi:uncharacterized protein (TIGR02145 family)
MNSKLTKFALTAILGLAITFTFNACEEKKKQDGTDTTSSEPAAATATEQAAQYKTVKIGEQVWMAENLNIETEGSKCYANTPANCQKYGRLYDWETAMKVCASGWHLPSNEEWDILVNFAGGKDIAGKKLKAKSGWIDYEGESGNGTDNYGFSALPGGFGGSDGDFGGVGGGGIWWSSNKSSNDEAARGMGYSDEYVSYYGDVNYDASDDTVKTNLFSVRCLQGDAKEAAAKVAAAKAAKEAELAATAAKAKANGGTFTDARDKKTYKTVKIGNQTWMAENLNYKTESGSWCYENEDSNCVKYGRLYDWETAMEVCPAGWKLPSFEEWDKLIIAVGGRATAGKKLKSKSGWDDFCGYESNKPKPCRSGNGTDEFGFGGLPSGEYHPDSSTPLFYGVGNRGDRCSWWMAESTEGYQASNVGMFYARDRMDMADVPMSFGYSVRCLQ